MVPVPSVSPALSFWTKSAILDGRTADVDGDGLGPNKDFPTDLLLVLRGRKLPHLRLKQVHRVTVSDFFLGSKGKEILLRRNLQRLTDPAVEMFC